MSKQHTPGPWKVRNSREVFCGNKRVCSANAASREPLNMKDDLDVSSANARLIAAAPDLLESLKLAVRQNEHDMLMTGEELRQCRAAIEAVEEGK